jgi:hypothetical protein
MNVTLTNITTVYSHVRPISTACLRNDENVVISPSIRLADQLLFAEQNGLTIVNALEALRILVITLGFAS